MRKRLHEAEIISVKSALVDKRIAPVVHWLAALDGVLPRFSCEGNAGSTNTGSAAEQSRPYVLFYCDEPTTLMHIVEATQFYGAVELAYTPACGLRYVLRFRSVKQRDNFVNGFCVGL